MKKLNLLKALIDLFFFFAVIATLGMLVILPIFFSDGQGMDVKINGSTVTVVDWPAKILMVFALAAAICFIYSIYLLRKIVGHFVKREIFHTNVISLLNGTGKYLIAYALLVNVPLFFYEIIERQHVGIEFSNGGPDSFLMSVSLGLFFMVLSEVFKIAKNMKDENELMI